MNKPRCHECGHPGATRRRAWPQVPTNTGQETMRMHMPPEEDSVNKQKAPQWLVDELVEIELRLDYHSMENVDIADAIWRRIQEEQPRYHVSAEDIERHLRAILWVEGRIISEVPGAPTHKTTFMGTIGDISQHLAGNLEYVVEAHWLALLEAAEWVCEREGYQRLADAIARVKEAQG